MNEIRQIDLDEAIRQIRRTCELQTRPFFFMVGAGISCPPIPLASEMVEECRQIAQGTVEPAGLSSMDGYSFWLRAAFPSRADRQKYLRRLIEHKCVSHANLRLAHILLSKRVGNLVVTTNFDDFVSRALALFGEPHILCDHPDTVQRIDPESLDVQIVHVHGTYWFYDCCNLKEEVASRSKRPDETSFSMADLLDHVLRNRSPLVVGYSGWENDVFMAALKRRLKRPLPYNLYWFCYRREAIEQLPEELRANENVFFVVPPRARGGSLSAVDERVSPEDVTPREHAEPSTPPAPLGQEPERTVPLSSLRRATSAPRAPLGQEPEPARLPAAEVFERLVAGFGLEAPPLTRDPLRFLADHLRRSLPPDEEQVGGADTYVISRVLFQIERANELLAESTTGVASRLETIFDAVRRSQYEEACRSASGISVADLDPGQLSAFVDSIWTAAKGVSESATLALGAFERVIEGSVRLLAQSPDSVSLKNRLAEGLIRKGIALGDLNRHEEEVRAYEQVMERFGHASELSLRDLVAWALANKAITLGQLNRHEEEVGAYEELIERFGQASELSLRVCVARALVNKGMTLRELSRQEEEVQACDQVVERFGQAPESSLRVPVARALVNKGIALGQLKRHEEEVQAYDQVLERFGQAPELPLRERVAWALVSKGWAFRKLNRHEEEVRAYDDVVERFGQAPELPLREQVAWALVHKGVALGKLNRHEEEVRAYDDVVERFGQAPELPLREQVARALGNKGLALRKLNRHEEEVRAYDQVVERFGQAPELPLREQVAWALGNKGLALRKLNRHEEKVDVYDQVVQRFGGATEPPLQDAVCGALNGIGFALLCEAKRYLCNADQPGGGSRLQEAHRKLLTALQVRPEHAYALGNLGYVEFLLGNGDRARELLTRAISLGGEGIRQGEIEDSKIHELPQDEEFRKLVLAIPSPAESGTE